jgi:hypothetical protein
MLRKKAIAFISWRSRLNKNHANNICSTPSKNRITDIILFIKQYLITTELQPRLITSLASVVILHHI